MIRSVNGETVLVAGARGFIGSHVVRALADLAPSVNIVQLDRDPPRSVDGSVYYYDIAAVGIADLSKLLSDTRVTAVINCAGTTVSALGPLRIDNVDTTERLVDAAALLNPKTVFCQIGSSAEYEMLEPPNKTREDSPTRPRGDYGRSKLAASTYVLRATWGKRLAGYVLRLFNPIGPRMPTTQLVGRILHHVRSGTGEPLRLGNLDGYRDYIDVRDVARAIVSSLAMIENTCGKVINIGSGRARSTRSLVEAILENAHAGGFVEDAEEGSLRSKWANWQEADISKAKALLGWEPIFAFDETVKHLVASEFVRTQPDCLPKGETE